MSGCWGASILNFDSQVMHKFTMNCEYFIQSVMLLIFNAFIDFFFGFYGSCGSCRIAITMSKQDGSAGKI